MTGYEILRAVDGGEMTTLAVDTQSKSVVYIDEAAVPGKLYAYQVVTIQGEQKSQPSNRVQVRLPHEDRCPASDPNPVEIEVTSVPIVVESTTDEYFVLYVQHELGMDITVSVPVAVILGESGHDHAGRKRGGAAQGALSRGEVPHRRPRRRRR